MSSSFPPDVYDWPPFGDTEEEFPPAGEAPLTRQESVVWDDWRSLSAVDRHAMTKLHPEMRLRWRWDHDFLPIGEPVAIGCGASSPTGMRCTRDPGHGGDHASHASPRLMMARWQASGAQEDEP